jgi:hypothetical protein
VREQKVVGVFELFADRANAFEERDVTALERLAEMVQTGVEHADAAKRAMQEIAAKNEEAVAKQKEQKQSEPAPVTGPEKSAVTAVAAAPEAKTQEAKAPKPEALEPVRAPVLDKIRKCEACGFPVSEGRTLCLDCETARCSGDNPSPLAGGQPPAFLAKFEGRKEQGWLGSHIYTIGTVLIIVLTIVLVVLRLR